MCIRDRTATEADEDSHHLKSHKMVTQNTFAYRLLTVPLETNAFLKIRSDYNKTYIHN